MLKLHAEVIWLPQGTNILMAKDTTANRLPRGTKVVTRAFFDAADGFPEATRPAVIKAALAAIREEIKTLREKTITAKAKANATPSKVAPKSAAKPSAGKGAKSKKAAPKKAAAPIKTKTVTKKKAALKKSAPKKAKAPTSDNQAIAEAFDVARTTSPEVSSTEA